MHTLYLASSSPRRYRLLSDLGYHIHTLRADIDETPHTHESAETYVQRMAQEKNQAALHCWQQQHSHEPEFPIITADTCVALNHRILGKPLTIEHAKSMLKTLSGNTHQVLTAVCIYFQGKQVHTLQTSHVHFKTLSEQEIQHYLNSGEPMDKAGAYGIQGLAGVFIEHLEGSFTGVMGLPVYETCQLLKQLGVAIPPFA